MNEDLEKGDVSETAKTFFEASEGIVPAKTSTLTLADVSLFSALNAFYGYIH